MPPLSPHALMDGDRLNEPCRDIAGQLAGLLLLTSCHDECAKCGYESVDHVGCLLSLDRFQKLVAKTLNGRGYNNRASAFDIFAFRVVGGLRRSCGLMRILIFQPHQAERPRSREPWR